MISGPPTPPSPSASQPPAPAQGKPTRAPTPRTSLWLVMLHWALVVGGLLIVVDLTTLVLGLGTAPEGSVDGQMLALLDMAVSFALEIFVGVRVYRATSSVVKALLAGLLASLIEGLFLTAAFLGNPVVFGSLVVGTTLPDILVNSVGENVLFGTLMAAGGALASASLGARKGS